LRRPEENQFQIQNSKSQLAAVTESGSGSGHVGSAGCEGIEINSGDDVEGSFVETASDSESASIGGLQGW